MIDEAVAMFHRHLDCCRRCREEPMNLCPIGAQTLRQAVCDVAVEKLHEPVEASLGTETKR